MTTLMLLGGLSWLAIQVCYLHVLRIGGRGTESATDWLLPFLSLRRMGVTI